MHDTILKEGKNLSLEDITLGLFPKLIPGKSSSDNIDTILESMQYSPVLLELAEFRMREGKAVKTEMKPQNAWEAYKGMGEGKKGNLILLNIY